MREVFISYHAESAGALVRTIAERLEAAGISCWYAQRDMPIGGDFSTIVPQQIANCKVFLLIVDQGAVKSEHVHTELYDAFERYNQKDGISILPIQVEEFELSDWARYFLRTIQIKKYLSPDKAAIRALVEDVAHALGREPAKNGWCGPGAQWTLKDGILTISKIQWDNMPDSDKLPSDMKEMLYAAKIADFYPQEVPQGYNSPWWTDCKEIASVIIQKPITEIGMGAFYDCSNLKSVIIPDSVTKIGMYSFCDCSNLSGVAIPESVIVIKDNAFRGCSSLSNVIIPGSVIEVSIMAFAGCKNLTNVTILDGVTSISIGAFYDCPNLSNVVIPDSVACIYPMAFKNCPNLKSASIPKNAENVFGEAFDPHTKIIRRRAK